FTVTPSGSPALPGILAEEEAFAAEANAARAGAAAAYAAEVDRGIEPACDDGGSDLLDRRCEELRTLLDEAGDRTGDEELTLEDADRYFAILTLREEIVDERDRLDAERNARIGNIAGPVV